MPLLTSRQETPSWRLASQSEGVRTDLAPSQAHLGLAYGMQATPQKGCSKSQRLSGLPPKEHLSNTNTLGFLPPVDSHMVKKYATESPMGLQTKATQHQLIKKNHFFLPFFFIKSLKLFIFNMTSLLSRFKFLQCNRLCFQLLGSFLLSEHGSQAQFSGALEVCREECRHLGHIITECRLKQ